jgi:hypothetical protein
MRRSTTGKLCRTSLKLFLLETGMGQDLLSMPQETIQLLPTDSLVKSTCNFLWLHNLDLRHDIVIRPLRKHDQALMRAFYALKPSHEELLMLNRCRLYLQVYFLSKICTGDEMSLAMEAWNGNKFEVPYKKAVLAMSTETLL